LVEISSKPLVYSTHMACELSKLDELRALLAGPLGFEPRTFGFLQPLFWGVRRPTRFMAKPRIHAALRTQFCALKEEVLRLIYFMSTTLRKSQDDKVLQAALSTLDHTVLILLLQRLQLQRQAPYPKSLYHR
jgi:hypothetical protein